MKKYKSVPKTLPKSHNDDNWANFEITYDLHMFSGLLDMYLQFTERKPSVYWGWHIMKEHPGIFWMSHSRTLLVNQLGSFSIYWAQ